MLNRKEVATGYAKSAERILAQDISFLERNPEVVPIFVSLLFQSLEISLKHFGIESTLFTEVESRDRKLTKNGHGIKEIAELANKRLGASKDYPIIMALTYNLAESNVSDIIRKMIFGAELEPTRLSYGNRNLGYAQLKVGEIQIFQDLEQWVFAVKGIAENLDISTGIALQWTTTTSASKHFAIWVKE